jgi:hypothetical protein
MSKIQILVTGRNEPIVQTVERLINNNPQWNALCAYTDEDTITAFETQPVDLVLLCGGISAESDTLLRRAFATRNPRVTIIQHYGGGSGLLSTEINMALEGRPAINSLQ